MFKIVKPFVLAGIFQAAFAASASVHPVDVAAACKPPGCLNKESTLIVSISKDDYDRLERLRKGSLRKSGLNREQFYAELNTFITEERVKNERLFQSILKLSEASEAADVIERLRLAVETQEQLDQKFGIIQLSVLPQQDNQL
ncbi:MAG: hypothetical protein KF799_08160 [Bdellovibrionales bacterium]|nr:hypothetical protein [Bdellovibrionales bacterium]